MTVATVPVWRSKLGCEYPRDQIQRLDAEHHQILKQLRTLPGNDVCADCGLRDTTWASVNLGVFLCVHCADLHRGMGTHISKPKGCSGTYLWGPDEIEQMQNIGNQEAKNRYFVCQSEGALLDSTWNKEKKLEFCRRKYETAQPAIQQCVSSLQVRPTSVVIHTGACNGIAPMQLQTKMQAIKDSAGNTETMDIFSDDWQPSTCKTPLAVPAATTRVQPRNVPVASHGIAKPCPQEFDIDGFFNEQLERTDFVPTVSDQFNKSKIIESLDGCFPNSGNNTVLGAVTTDATDACVVVDSGFMTVARAAHPISNSPTVVAMDTNIASNTNNWPAFDFDSDDFFQQFLGNSPSAAKAA